MPDLLLEPFGGMAGDMLLAALCDLERDAFGLEDLRGMAAGLLPGECRLSLKQTMRGSLRALHLEVRTPETREPVHRSLADLLERVDGGPLGAAAKERAGRVLTRLARAEAGLHATSIDAVHFHELGAVDTLIDVCGAVLALERLGIERVLSTTPYVGGGSVQCAHGEMPVPAPATAELLRGWSLTLGPGGERLTPTAAALLAELAEPLEGPVRLRLSATGYGAGSRDPEQGPPNLLRVSLAESAPDPGPTDGSEPERHEVWELRCNLDDVTGEEVGFLMAELRRGGVLDAWSAPVTMKKERPGVLVSALCRAADRERIEGLLFQHTPTLGVRWTRCERTECERGELAVEMEGVRVRVKQRFRPGLSPTSEPLEIDLSPELDDLAVLARATGRPLRELEGEVVRRALAEYGGG